MWFFQHQTPTTYYLMHLRCFSALLYFILSSGSKCRRGERGLSGKGWTEDDKEDLSELLKTIDLSILLSSTAELYTDMKWRWTSSLIKDGMTSRARIGRRSEETIFWRILLTKLVSSWKCCYVSGCNCGMQMGRERDLKFLDSGTWLAKQFIFVEDTYFLWFKRRAWRQEA